VSLSNGDNDPVLRMKMFGCLMKGEARVWHTGLPAQADWDSLKKVFLKEWRGEGAKAKAFTKLNSSVLMRKGESLRSYMQKVQKLAKKIDPAPPANLIMEWFIQGLYPSWNNFVRRMRPNPLDIAHEIVQSYIDSNMS
jgi:hypothetical protein